MISKNVKEFQNANHKLSYYKVLLFIKDADNYKQSHE